MPAGGTPPYPWHLEFFETVDAAIKLESVDEILVRILESLDRFRDDYETDSYQV
jgi:hypothetical protein